MKQQAESNLATRLEFSSRAASVITCLIGGIVLLGWGLDIALLRGRHPYPGAMVPNTAFLFILAGLALWLSAKPSPALQVSRLFAVFVALAGALILGEYVAGWDLGIDRLWFRQETLALGSLYPGRLAPQTAIGFILVGLALLSLGYETPGKKRPSEPLVLLAIVFPYLAILGYAYQLDPLYRIASYIEIALYTALAFIILGLGILFARPGGGFMAIIARDTPGSGLVRRIIPTALLVPPLLGWLWIEGERLGLYSSRTGDTMKVVSMTLLAIGLTSWSAWRLDQIDADRRQKEVAVRKAAREIEDLYNNAPTGYHSLGADGTFLRINDTELKWLGYARDEIVGKMTFADILAPDSLRRFQEGFSRFKAQGHIEDLEFDLIRKDGSILPVLLSATAVFDDEGGYVMSRATLFDMALRKQAEMALRESELRFRGVFEHSFEFVGLLTPEGILLEANQTSLALIGRSSSDVAGRPFWDTPWWSHSPELQQCLKEGIARAARGEVVRFEASHRRKNGGLAFVDFSLKPLVDESGQVRFIIPEGRDITELKEAEEALRASLATLAEAQRIAHVGNWYWDTRTDEIEGSEEIYRIFGLERVGQRVALEAYLSLVHPDDRPHVEQALAASRTRGSPYDLDMRIIRPDGKERSLHVQGEARYGEDGALLGLVGICQDITELREAEAQIARRTAELHKAQELAGLKDHFLSTISHEIKTPLSLIMGFAELLEEKYPHEHLLEALKEGSLRLTRHVDNILDYSALLSGSLPLYLTEVNLSEIVQDVIAGMTHDGEFVDRHLQVELDPATPAIQGDARRLMQASEELLRNASKYTAPGGTLGIRLAPADGDALLEVWDTGCGIPEEAFVRVWEGFSQLDIGDALRRGGLGLGLAIVKCIAELHGGSVAVESKVGEGSRFTMRLPATKDMACGLNEPMGAGQEGSSPPEG